MTSIFYIYAFQSEDIREIYRFVDVAKHQLPDGAQLLVGVVTDSEIESDEIRLFPTKTNLAQVINNLAAEVPADQILGLANGAVTAHLDNSDFDVVSAMECNEFFSSNIRVPIIPPYFDENEIQKELPYLDFGKRQHDISPAFLFVTREDFMRIRGMDERASHAAVIFSDLLARLLRAGVTQRICSTDTFVADLNQIYKIHLYESEIVSVAEQNKRVEIVSNDESIYRNLVDWSVPSKFRRPLVSVAIATRDRADYLRDSIHSIQNQTFEDWELILVDDGSEDETQTVVRSFSDPRIKYYFQEPSGISRARNLASDKSSAYFTAVHDDDDIMLPWRLETSLAAISADAQATYGSWVNFQNKTAEMALHITKRDFGKDLISYSGQTPGHATWLLPTSLVRELRYDETLTSSVDHNLAVRTLMCGVTWKHTEKVLFIRRIHDTQVSVTDSRRQRNAAILTRFASGFPATHQSRTSSVERGKLLTFPSPVDRKKLFETFGLYLPDHLVHRSLKISGLVGKKVLGLDLHDRFTHIIAEQDLLTDRSSLEVGGASSLLWEDMVAIRKSGFIGCKFSFSRVKNKSEPVSLESPSTTTPQEQLSERVIQVMNQVRNLSPSGILVQISAENGLDRSILDSEGLVLARHLTMNYDPYLRESLLLIGFSGRSEANAFVNSIDLPKADITVLAPAVVDFDIFSQGL